LSVRIPVDPHCFGEITKEIRCLREVFPFQRVIFMGESLAGNWPKLEEKQIALKWTGTFPANLRKLGGP
jgi:hypothetical protein